MNQKVLKSNFVRPVCFVLAIFFHLCLFTVQANELSFADINQNRPVTGKVIDSEGVPLAGVVVTVKGTTTGVLTDGDGKYSIDVKSKDAVLVFSLLGYTSIEKVANTSIMPNVTLEEKDSQLQEVVVVAYGTQKKETVTGAIAAVKGDVLKNIPAGNITNTLAGQMTGLSVVQEAGQPGKDAAKLSIRGQTTWGDSSPLIVIDGIEQESFSYLNSSEIESISILKDASSTAVYGIRGANGVILITTKRGAEGKPKINLTANWSIQTPTRTPEFLGSYDHMLLKRVAYDNDKKLYEANMSDEYLEGYRTGSDPYKYPSVKWYDEIFNGVKNPMQQYNVNVSGGTQRVKYFVNVGYLNQDGALRFQDLQKEYNPAAFYKKLSMRSNIDLTINKYVTLSANISGRSDEINGVENIDKRVFAGLFSVEPWKMPLWNPNGTIGVLPNQGSQISTLAYSGYQNTKMNYYDIIGTIKTDLSFITKGLSFNASYSFNNRYGNVKYYTDGVDTYYYDPTSETYSQITYDAPFGYNGTGSEDQTRKTFFKREALQLRLAYSKTIGLNDINAVLVYNQQKELNNNLQFLLPASLMGYAGRVEYAYAKKYLAEVSVGYNGSENFAKGYRFGFFPSASLGYVITEEKFMEPITEVLPYLKIRGSMGIIGNDKGQSTRFLYMGEFGQVGSPLNAGDASWIFGTQTLNGNGGLYEKRAENPNLGWETATKKNIGVDGQLFGNQLISFSFDYFEEKRRDILMQGQRNLQSIGLAASWGNLGRTEGWGYEAELTHRNKIGNVEYSIRGVYSFARNKVLSYDEPAKKATNLKREGYRINQLKGYKVIGYFQDQADIDNSPSQVELGGPIVPGDLKYFDYNGDGKITNLDMVEMGYATGQPEISYSISPSVSWKGFTLSCMFQGVSNASLFLAGYAMYDFSGTGSQVYEIHKDYWRPDNPNPSYPSLHSSPTHSNKQNNSFFLQDASYLKLRNLKLGYNFPTDFCKKMKMTGLEVYVSGTNLYTWTNMLMWDPEMTASGADYFPQQSVYNVGININF